MPSTLTAGGRAITVYDRERGEGTRMPAQRTIRVTVALSEGASEAIAALQAAGFDCGEAEDLVSVESMMSETDVVVTDLGFASGAFADWLSLWPIPAILAVEPSVDASWLAERTADESSAFLLKDGDGSWVNLLPTLARKCAAIRESIDRQNSHLVRAESSYMHMLRIIPDIVYMLDGDGYFVYLNDAVSQLGWKPAELIGRHYAELVHPDDLPEVGRTLVLRRYDGVTTGASAAPKLFDERRTGDRMTRGLEVRLRHKTDPVWTQASVDAWGEVASLGVKLPEFQGSGLGTIGIIHDVSERRALEIRLSKELEARDLLLKEMHHRVKNDLQVVSSLLSLESNSVADPASRKVFADCQTQVHSMALVHEQLYRGSSLEGVAAAAYLARLAEYLSEVHDATARGIAIRVESGDTLLPLESAIPLSIIATELVSNSFKHGFPGGRQGTVTVSLVDRDGAIEFSVADDGVGFAASEAARRASPSKGGIGMDLVEALASQIGATLERREAAGAATVLLFNSKP